MMEIEIGTEKLYNIMRNWVADGWRIEFEKDGNRLLIDEIEQTHIANFRLFSPDHVENGHNALCVFSWDKLFVVKE